MRLIGYLNEESAAVRFRDYLLVEGVQAKCERETDGRWAVWVLDEDSVDRAHGWLREFHDRPLQDKFVRARSKAAQIREEEKTRAEEAGHRQLGPEQVFRERRFYGIGIVTGLLLGISGAVWFWSDMANNRIVVSRLLMSLPEIQRGEVWRLISPIFLHFSWAHIIFNLLWIKDLGSMVEARQGAGRLVLLVAVIGMGSNLGQYWISGPSFGGMSGVVYGLIGYVWLRGHFDPRSGLFLSSQEIILAIVWFIICFMGWVGPIANTAHAAGLGIGAAWGYVSAMIARRR